MRKPPKWGHSELVKEDGNHLKGKVNMYVLHSLAFHLANFNAVSHPSLSSRALSHKPGKLGVPMGPPQSRGKVTSQEMKPRWTARAQLLTIGEIRDKTGGGAEGGLQRKWNLNLGWRRIIFHKKRHPLLPQPHLHPHLFHHCGLSCTVNILDW